MQKTIWLEGIKNRANNQLKKDIKCDILIIGGGIAGLSTALKLKDENYNIVLIDKGKIGHGVTSKTTGKLTYLQGDIYSKIEKIYDPKTAKNYLESQINAVRIAVETIKKYNINCDIEKVDSYIFSNNNLEKEREMLNKAKIPYKDVKNLPINFPCNDALYVNNTAVFHPIKYLIKIKEIIKDKIKIYENTPALNLDIKDNKYFIKTKKGSIKAKKVIVCTHYPFFVIPGLMPLKLHQERSYVVVSKEENKHFSAINIDKPELSIRYQNNYMLLGGFTHHLSDVLNYQKKQDKLINFHQKYFKEKIIYKWQVHDNMTTDYIPLIGKLNSKHPNLLIATGFNKWGMTNGILAGEILSDIILNRKNRYEKLFSPTRKINLNKILNSINNNFKIGKTYISLKLIKPKMKNAYITKINGTIYGVYVDENNQKHFVKNICPHLKCRLVFNDADKTWDCPCHGSRFSIDGQIKQGPSVFSIKKTNIIDTDKYL